MAVIGVLYLLQITYGVTIMKDRYIKILLTVIAINLTVISLNSVVDRFVSEAIAETGIQRVMICDPQRPKICANIAATDSYSLLRVMR